MNDTQDEVVVGKKSVNFLDIAGKRTDWRFSAYQTLKNDSSMMKSVYWIASLFLKDVSEEVDCYPLSFFNKYRLVEDGELGRNEDGSRSPGYDVYSFNLSEIKSEIMEARKAGHLFCTMFIEETVDESGAHEVYALHRHEPGDTKKIAISSHAPWYKLPAELFLDLSSYELDEHVERILLLKNKHYSWLK